MRFLARWIFRNQSYSAEIPTEIGFESGRGWQRIVMGNPGHWRACRAFAIVFGLLTVVLFLVLLQTIATGSAGLLAVAGIFLLCLVGMFFWIWLGTSTRRQVVLVRYADHSVAVGTRLGWRRLDAQAVGIGLFSISNSDSMLLASCCSGVIVYEGDRHLFPVMCSSPENASHVLSTLISFLGNAAIREPTELETAAGPTHYRGIHLNTGFVGMRDPVLPSK